MTTIAKHIASDMNDRDIMLFLGQVRGLVYDLGEFSTASSQIKSVGIWNVLRDKLRETLDELGGTVEEIEDIYHALDITVDDLGYYPVLFRGKVKPFEWINLSNVQSDSIPLNPSGFKTAQLVRGRVPVPPISVVRMDNGNYKVQDGRHRFLAFRLNGLEKIPAYVNPGRRGKFNEALKKTGEENAEVFRQLAKGPEDED